MATNARPLIPSPASLGPGDHIGPYEVVAKIADGGMASVYEVSQGERVYAIKILKSCFLDDSVASDEQREYRLRADREFLAAKALDHPNILRAFAFERWPELARGWPYIVTEFVDGQDLCRWRDEEEPSLYGLLVVLAKVADALGHIHAAGLFHRDLKASNILVRRGSFEPVVIDLGVARHTALPPLTQCAEMVGTCTHFAPEYVVYLDSDAYAAGEPFAWSVQTDLYAFGYVAYELVTGRPPVAAPSRGQVANFAAIKQGAVARPREVNESVPVPLDALLMRLLAKDPAERPASAQEVQLALREMVEREAAALGEGREGSFAVPPPPPPPPAPARGRKPDFIPTWMWKSRPAPPSTGEARSRVGAQLSAAREEVEEGEQGGAEAAAAEAGAGRGGEMGAETGATVPAATKAAKKDSGITRAIREAEEQLARAAPRRWRRAVLLVAAGALACLLVVVLGRSGHAPAGPDHLLARLEREEAQSRRGTSAPSSPPWTAPPELPPRAPAEQPLSGSPPPAAPKAVSPPSPADARDIDAAIAARYGRPTVPPGGVPEGTPAPATGPADAGHMHAAGSEVASAKHGGGGGPAKTAIDDDPLVHAQLVATAEAPAAVSATAPGTAPAAARKLGIALGTHIRARLVTNLDSRTIAGGLAEATLPQPLVLRGAVVLPARTMLYGRASELSGRFSVRFTQARLPDDSELAFEGIALDRGDNKPGLAAGARVAPAEGVSGDGLGARIARNTGNVLLSSVTGGLAEDAVRGAGEAIVNDREASNAGRGTSAILLEAGGLFDVFVLSAF